jgi:hypothetical protein
MNGWNLSQSLLFPYDVVVVDFFFFDEEERRNAKSTTTKKRARKKREETRPRESKLPGVLEPPLSVLSQKRLFIHLPFHFS